MSDPLPVPQPAPQIVAHRGDPIHEVENTLAAIRRAHRDGAEMVEVDLRLTADGDCVLLHDATTARLWGIDRPVREQRTSELPEGIPLLRDALAAAPVRLLLDIPDDDPVSDLARAAVHVVREAGADVAFCGEETAMQAVRAADQGAEIRLTWNTLDPLPDELVEQLRPSSWNPSHELVDAASIVLARAQGLAVTCWTVDDISRARELAALGVDAITSNRAGELRATLNG
ncbi:MULTISPECIES: glycerophosphodiester phosphodiesterase [unclassified Brachybacterium]|uniref:glycerophosphodiester phosphodiesterase n=1 Tax=unclassified Brachybacterium TaxID=2623841 RepID=UPI0040339A47